MLQLSEQAGRSCCCCLVPGSDSCAQGHDCQHVCELRRLILVLPLDFFLLSLLFLSALATQVQHRMSKQPTLNIKVSLPQVQPRVTREITASTSVLTMDTLTFACVMTDTS